MPRKTPALILRSLAGALLLAAAPVVCARSTVNAQQREWQPEKTWVFVVGLLRWKHPDTFGSFPQRNRRDAQLVNFFRAQGVPNQQIIYLKDEQATARRIDASFTAFLSRAKKGDLLFFYYCGHGYKSDDASATYFAPFDAGDDGQPGWTTESIIRNVEWYFRGSRALLTADCCYSGSLAEQARQPHGLISYACLTSSSASQLSTENWTFTESLLSGLSGKSYADLNQDGRITLNELANNISEDMAFAERQRSSFVATGNFKPETVLAPAGRRSNAEISKRVEVKSAGKWWKARVIDARAGAFRVHYYGWETSDDEWVKLSQMREPGVVEYPAGSNVEVSWKSKWYPAKVVNVERGVHLIHYVGYGAGWDEWVGAERIRRPKVAQ